MKKKVQTAPELELSKVRRWMSPETSAARVILACENGNVFGDAIDINVLLKKLKEDSEAIECGQLNKAESMLINQADALQTLFTKLIVMATNSEYLSQFEAYLKLGLRAQNQSRMTLETLAAMKNPPLIVAKQANIANGHQQINNLPPGMENQNPQNELLERTHGERMDTRAKGKTGGNDQALAPVGAVDGAEV